MQLLLTVPILNRLQRELRRAGRREIGGVLMGEHVQDEVFRVVDFSVQHSGGWHCGFIRRPDEHQAQLDQFFRRTGADYTRFNYLGEWHSHPSFEPLPSITDFRTMQSIVDDPAVGVNFLVLLIPRLARWRKIELSAMVFRKGGEPYPVSLSVERTESEPAGIFVQCMRWIFRL
jgi:integrative and conjugative element protein (TIGR02256 family)